MIQLTDVAKTYGSTRALFPTSLTLAAGETMVLIGPSGCGKSTLLRLMIGLIRPDAGAVRFEGTTLTPENALDVRRRMGYVVQEGGLFPHLTARQNVTLAARQFGWTVPKMNARVSELAELVQLPKERLSSYPAQLSGGQRQRVSLMRALMLDPDVLLLDEPLGALDPMIRSDLQADLRRIFRHLGKSVVMVTHDLYEAGYFGDTLILMREGRIVQRGSLADLLDRPAEPFVETFIRAQETSLDALREEA
ncbi:MAG: ATP-binding cassette domain-containing protein [Rhodothermales bacterium]